MRSVVFLDIDGVMRTRASDLENAGEEPVEKTVFLRGLSRKAVSLLNKLVHTCKADVVISSTWRINVDVDFISDVFRKHGFTGKIIGTTPYIGSRGEEIQTWLDMNGYHDHVIIDDHTNDILLHHPHNRVITVNHVTGFTEADLERAIEILS